MPLRDHFRPPLSDRRSWDELHGGWPMMIVADLNRKLPDRYVAVPQVHPGSSFEVNVATYDHGETDGGGAATSRDHATVNSPSGCVHQGGCAP